MGGCEVAVIQGRKEVFGIVFWSDAVVKSSLVTGLFLGSGELAVGDPDEGMKPEDRSSER